jgi:NAD-dependent dihydropyrimidine dehydrogenase PreA subunit
MRKDAIFIGVEVDDDIAGDPAIAAKLTEVCPVDIYNGSDAGVQIVEENLDECVLCKLCYEPAAGKVRVLKLYDGEAVL